MFWLTGRSRPVVRYGWLRGIVSVALLGIVVAAAGCATPRGEVFPLIDPPVVWPKSPEQARIRLVGVIADSGDLKAGKSSGEAFKQVLRGPRPPIKFSSPHDVVSLGNGKLAITDGNASAVHLIDLQDRTHTVVSGWLDQKFDVPLGVCRFRNRLAVTDAGRGEIIVLGLDGSFHGVLGHGLLTRPVGIAYVEGRDRFYVVDTKEHCVKMIGGDGTLIGSIGGPGTEQGLFNYPTHIAWNGADRLLVSDSGNFRVQLLDLDGACIAVVGKKGDGAGDLSLPKGVAFDRDGHIFAVDAHFENVQIFNDQGQILLAFGREGDGQGEFSLPAGMDIDGDDRIWVADSANRRIQVFEYLRNSG